MLAYHNQLKLGGWLRLHMNRNVTHYVLVIMAGIFSAILAYLAFTLMERAAHKQSIQRDYSNVSFRVINAEHV